MGLKIIMIIMAVLLSGCSLPDNTMPNGIQRQGRVTPAPATPVQTPGEYEIGYFKTKILDKEEERVNNLRICARVLDGYVVEAGETFSFNDAVGSRTSDKGYEEARILINGKKEYAVGGGVCQISSTIYNAVNEAGLKIVERHNHDRDVHYVPLGKDAAVSYGTLDFKFTNNLANDIKLVVTVDEEHVHAKVMEIR